MNTPHVPEPSDVPASPEESTIPAHDDPAATSPPARWRPPAPMLGLAILAAVAVLAVVLLTRLTGIGLSHEELADLTHTTIQREIAAAFVVTGELEVTATTRVRNTRTLLPGLLDVDLGTTSASVRVPGRVIYGFDVAALTRDRIHVREDGIVEIRMPDPRVYAVEPALSQIEIETERGWARLSPETMEQVRDRAIALIEESLRAQGTAHLERSMQPRINSAQAIAAVLRPALVAAGVESPTFRFILDESLTWEDRPDR